MKVLQIFSKESSLVVDMDKSSIFFLENMSDEEKGVIRVTMPFRPTSIFGKYLGYPLEKRGLNQHQLNYILF